ncbi:response regulator [Yeosuana sp. MJ-SS3]|uniref:Response regulator n=1 Tax=Gilvirhabdus luticola TaxID=3079858 RepID=A0ABU3U7D5_9FLAO|nr:response regulator [Yeosuana sp. MJ-SS3]MDU8886328.1 response regulator [Yeosuana sp. MJ-SS3]
MFNKVLVADDLGSIHLGVLTVIDSLGIKNVQQVQYCDDAYLRIKKGLLDKTPFDLLITDLSFKADHREQKFPTGELLIQEIKNISPDLPIIVYSIEDRLHKVRTLINVHGVKAYVCKGRRGLIELSSAIQKVYNNERYLSPQVSHVLSNKYALEIDDFDILLLKNLANGYSQEEISQQFKKQNIKPSSLSSIEKRLNKLRIQFKANNAIHLVAIVKDIGLI